jgi:phosphoserine phosphatase
MDGVIFEGKNFWLDLHKAYGTVKEGLELADRHLASDYELLARTVAEKLWKDKPVSVYQKMIDERAYQPGVEDVFEYLHRSRIQTAIVSSGPYHLAVRAQKQFGIDEVWANRLLIKDGKFQGRVELMVSDTAKESIGEEIMKSRGVTAGDTAFVGDSDSDVALASLVGLPVAYDSTSERLTRLCQHVLKYGELSRLKEFVV